MLLFSGDCLNPSDMSVITRVMHIKLPVAFVLSRLAMFL